MSRVLAFQFIKYFILNTSIVVDDLLNISTFNVNLRRFIYFIMLFQRKSAFYIYCFTLTRIKKKTDAFREH